MSILLIILGIIVLYFSDIVTGSIRFILDKIEDNNFLKNLKKEISSIRKLKDNDIEKEVTRYVDFEDMLENGDVGFLNQLRRRNDLVDWLICNLWYRILEHPEDLRLWLIAKYQRANRGWANRDTWSLDYHLAKVVIGGCEYLKKTKHGIPSLVFNENDEVDEIGNHTDEAFDKVSKRWDDILDSIILTFKIIIMIEENGWFYQPIEEYSISRAVKMRYFNKKLRKESSFFREPNYGHVMTKEECRIYDRGWKNFQKYYFGLND